MDHHFYSNTYKANLEKLKGCAQEGQGYHEEPQYIEL